FELIGKMRAIFRFTRAEGLFLAIVSRRQVVDAGQERTEHLSMADDAADGGAAKADAVIAAFAADQADAAALAVDLVIGQRDLERGVCRFRAGIAEEHMVEACGRQFRDAAGELEGLRDAELK